MANPGRGRPLSSSSSAMDLLEQNFQLLSTSSGTIAEEGEEEGEIVAEEEVFEGQQQPAVDPLEPRRFFEVAGSKGKSLLTLSGYEYCFDKYSKADTGGQYYRCVQKKPYCSARILVGPNWQTDDNGRRYKMGHFTRIENSEHNHAAIEGKEMIRDAIQTMRVSAQSDNPTSTTRMVNQARSAIPLPLRQNIASRNAMIRNYQLMKRKAAEELGDRGMDHANHQQIIIPQHISEAYVIYNEMINQQQRMIIFSSEFGLNLLMENNEIAIDGTFVSSPRNFSQIYTISVIIDRVAIPAVYSLLPGKTEQIYNIFFNQIKQRLPDWSPTLVMSDFERAALNSIKNEFPQIELTGCLFHLGQALNRNINKYPTLRAYYADNERRIKLKCFQSLSFVPPNEVINNLSLLMESFNDDMHNIPNFEAEFFEFCWYFITTWIGPARINDLPNDRNENFGVQAEAWIRQRIIAFGEQNRNALFEIELWNVTDRLQNDLSRTNNSVEGWHSYFNAQLHRHPRLSVLVKRMIEEDAHWFDKVNEFEINPADGIRGRNMKRREVYVRQDENLLTLFENRNAHNNPLRYLRAVAHHL